MGGRKENVQRQRKVETTTEEKHETQLHTTLHLTVTWVLGLSRRE